MMKHYKIVGIIGPKSTGKSCSLTALGYQLDNVVMFSLNSSNYGTRLGANVLESDGTGLKEGILCELRKNVYNVPWPFTRIRLSSVDAGAILANAFQRVRQDTGVPVSLLLDIDMKTQIAGFSCETLTRELKAMVCDARLMHCCFAASEGLLFQGQARREPRLRLFYSHELSVELALKYVGNGAAACDLLRFPRVFDQLDSYAISPDKSAFVEEFTTSGNQVLKKLSLSERNFLKCASSQAHVGVDEYQKFGLAEEVVMELVKKNILTVNGSGMFEIQFDYWRQAITAFKEKD